MSINFVDQANAANHYTTPPILLLQQLAQSHLQTTDVQLGNSETNTHTLTPFQWPFT